MDLLKTIIDSPKLRISEGISHIEDLPPDDFISTVKSLGTDSKIIDEKLDGNNLWFGLDEQGLFTSREGKSSKAARFYSADDYKVTANYNGFRAAHLAIFAVEDIIRKFLAIGDIVEIEVLFGRQTNTVTYGGGGLNYICFLRGINGTEEHKVSKLAAELLGKKVRVKSLVVSSDDGVTLHKQLVQQMWTFIKNAPVDISKHDLSNVNSILHDMEKYLSAKNESFPSYTNKEIENLSLNTIKKEDRESLKAERESVKEYILKTFKLKVKELLLTDIVRKIKPQLQDDSVTPDEDTGVEGVVVRDANDSDNQIKIVDKDVFTSINQFNSIFRAQVSGSVKTTDKDAEIEKRGGLFGQAKIDIAALFGAKELATAQGAKKIFTRYEGESEADTIANFAKGSGVDVSIKSSIIDILNKCEAEIKQKLEDFKKNKNDFKITLKTGKTLGISDDVYKRALTACAETLSEISDLKNAVNNSNNVEQLVSALFLPQVSKLHVKESYMKNTSLLTSIISEDGESATVATADTPAATTSADIAKPEVRFLNGRVVTKRKRTFKKKQKFSMNESLDNSGDDDAKNVGDMAGQSANSLRQKYSALRAVVNSKNSNTSKVADFLDTAHQINDEVDTVAFGLEDANGAVIKVHVNAEQGDEFHKALSDRLTNQDGLSIEDVLNELADEFDIVDVDWDYGKHQDSSGNDDELPSEFGDEENPEIDLSTATEENDPVVKESFLQSVVLEGKRKSNDELSGFSPEEIELLSHGGNSRSISKLLKRFSERGERGIIMLMISLGVPVNFISQYVKKFQESIQPFAALYLSDSVFRTRVKKFIQLAASTSLTEASKAEVIGNTFAGKYEHEVYYMLMTLGLPIDHFVTINKLIANISDVGNKIQKNGSLRTVFKQIKNTLKSESSNLKESIIHGVINSDDEEFLSLAEALLSTDPKQAIADIFTSFGFDMDTPKSINTQLKNPAVYQKVKRTLSTSRARNNLMQLLDVISSIPESVSMLEDILSDWVIVTTDSTVSLRNVDFSIKMNKIQSADFKDALQKKKGFAAEIDDILYVFDPLTSGYTVSAKIDDVEKEAQLSKSDIDTILEIDNENV